MTRILHVITSLNPGGAERKMAELVRHLDPDRFTSAVASLMSGGALKPLLEKDGVSVTELGIKRGTLPGWRALRSLARAVDRFNPDVIQGWMPHGNLAALRAARGVVPVAWNIRHVPCHARFVSRTTRVLLRLERNRSRKVDLMIVNSAASLRYHESDGYRPARQVVIPNAVDSLRFKPDPEIRERQRKAWGVGPDDFAVGLVARVHPVKGHDRLLVAANLLKERGVPIRIVLAGEGAEPSNPYLAGQVRALYVSDDVVFLGYQPLAETIYPALDAACLASYTESFPNMLTEAMACGTPCVAADAGDAHNIIGDTGIAVSSNTPENLCEGLECLWKLGLDGRSDLGARARRRAEFEFSRKQMVDQYTAAYNELTE